MSRKERAATVRQLAGAPMSRRRFLQLAAAAPLAATGAFASIRDYGLMQPATDGRLRLWWWGEEEAVGLSRWMDDTAAKFAADSGVRVEMSRLETSEVVARFTAAAAAGNPPDVQYLWNGSYHMENVWRGYLEPLNGLISRSVLQRSGATQLSVFDGKQYRAGFNQEGFGMAYNKVLFDRAGLNADDPPKTWEAFLNACDRIKAIGAVPFGGGVRDGYFGDWFFTNALIQNLNAPTEAIGLFIGDLDWREPRYHEHWVRLQELYRLGFLNDDITRLDHFPSHRLFEDGRFATCLFTSPRLFHAQEELGRGNVGFMVMPVFGRGRMAGIPILDPHGFGIPRSASDKRNAARFIEFMHTKERLQAMWQLSRQIPSDEAFDSSVVDDPLIRSVYETWVKGPHNPFIGNMMPTTFWDDIMFVTSQRILAGQIGGEQAADIAHTVTERWRETHPDEVNNYARWRRDLGLAP